MGCPWGRGVQHRQHKQTLCNLSCFCYPLSTHTHFSSPLVSYDVAQNTPKGGGSYPLASGVSCPSFLPDTLFLPSCTPLPPVQDPPQPASSAPAQQPTPRHRCFLTPASQLLLHPMSVICSRSSLFCKPRRCGQGWPPVSLAPWKSNRHAELPHWLGGVSGSLKFVFSHFFFSCLSNILKDSPQKAGFWICHSVLSEERKALRKPFMNYPYGQWGNWP